MTAQGVLTTDAQPERDSGAKIPDLVVFSVAFLWLVAYALYTGDGWEDFFISIRHSVNLVEGNGLTYQPGQRIQGFSSPLNVFVGAAAVAVTRGMPIDVTLWAWRMPSLAAFSIGLVFLTNALGGLRLSSRGLSVLIPAALYLLESKSVAFSSNGMETGFLLFFLAGALWVMAAGVGRHPWRMGVCWAGLLLTRPDSIVAIVLMAVSCLLWTAEGRRSESRGLAGAFGLAALVYLPWVLWAWSYYGSPVPLTILAKQPLTPWLLRRFLMLPANLPATWADLFLPPYAGSGGWEGFRPVALLLGAIGALSFLWTRGTLLCRRASLIAFGATCFLTVIPRAMPWYLPGAFLFTLPALGSVLGRLQNELDARRLGAGRLVLLLSLAPLLFSGWLLIDYAQLARSSMRVLEDGNRRVLGTWLARNAQPGDRVFLECPGFIGYYSGLTMLDYPGIVSPEVVQARRRAGDNPAAAAAALSPEWLVLRPVELEYLEAANPGWLINGYRLVQTFDASPAFRALEPLHPEALFGATFLVFRRGA